MVSTEFRIREMAASDVDAAVELALAQGWRNRRRFYELVMRMSTCEPLVGVVENRLIATGLATANGPVGWLGSIIVAEEHRGRGFGRTMTQELLRRLRARGCGTLALVASQAGRPLYERMGFRLSSSYHELEADHLAAPPVPPEGSRVRRLVPADLPAVLELDRRATAEDRSVPLAVLAAGEGWVLDDSDGLRGFLLPTERDHGAIIAPRFDDGLFLLDLHRHVVPAGAVVRAAIPDEHEPAWRELLARGWRETWLAPRMLLGPDVPWLPKWIWGQINSAMG